MVLPKLTFLVLASAWLRSVSALRRLEREVTDNEIAFSIDQDSGDQVNSYDGVSYGGASPRSFERQFGRQGK